MDYSPLFILLNEAMESLEGIFLLIANKSYSQAMTVYRLYLEQIITVIALVKNPKVIDKYIYHQKLTIRYAKSTMDSEVLSLIEEKHIPARDVKSYLNYGWIENLENFSDQPKNRYSIKMMAKLTDLNEIYELYSDSTNYVHMNYLLANVDWPSEINKVIEASFTTLMGIINNYVIFTGFNFVYKNINMINELSTILNEFIDVTTNKGSSYDILRLKSAQ